MSEKIGNVYLNDEFFIEEDNSDHEYQERLSRIFSEYQENEFNTVIAREKDARLIYDLSHIRQNLAEWLPIQKTQSVLEVGAGYGALTGLFIQRAGEVTVIDPSRKHCEILAKRYQQAENLQIYAGDFTEILEHNSQTYDWIFVLDSFEKSCELVDSANPAQDVLKKLRQKLSPQGKLVAACNNRLGLRFFAGCAEEHSKKYFYGVEGFADDRMPRSFFRAELERMAQAAGFEQQEFYYPYPDYRLPMTIYSDEYLPKVGELWDNLKNFEGERYALFDESKAFDGIIKDGLFPVFCNSYMMVLGNGEPDGEKRVIFSKYSNERSRQLAIRTDILEESKDKKRIVRKAACYEEGKQHVADLPKWYQKLGEVFEDSCMELNRCQDGENGVELEYLTGKTLEEELDHLLLEGKTKEAAQRLLDYLDIIRKAYSKESFQMTTQFEKIFGYQSLPSGLLCAPVTDLDMVVSNVMQGKQKKWVHLDYEWTFDFPIPANYVVFRVIQNFLYGNVERSSLYKELLYKRAGLSEQEIRTYRSMEEAFQRYVTGSHVPLRLLYEEVSPGIVDFQMEKQGDALKRQKAEQPGVEVFVEKFELSLNYVYITGWAVSKAKRQIAFRVSDGTGQELKVVDTSFHYRRDVVEHFQLGGMNSKPIFVVKCELKEKERKKTGTYTLIASDGQSEVSFPIPTDRLRLKQSVLGEKIMEFRGVKDQIQYLGPMEMGLIGESKKFRLDDLRYDAWRMANRQTKKEHELERKRQSSFSYRPQFTVIIPKTAEEKNTEILVKRSLESLKRQTYGQIEIQKGLSVSEAVEAARGEYVWILWQGDTLESNAFYEMAKILNQNRQAEIIYSDEDKKDWEEKQYFDPQFKPDFGEFTLLGGNYMGYSILFKKELISGAEIRGEAELYGLILRCFQNIRERCEEKYQDKILHIPKVLYHRSASMHPDTKEQKQMTNIWEKGKEALREYYTHNNEEAFVEWADYPQRYHTKWKIQGEPLVSVIIPNQDHTEDLELCVSSIVEKSTYRNFEILIVENNSKKAGTFLFYKKLEERYPGVRILNWEKEFNYSAINNFAVKEAKGEYLVFLNNDTEVLSHDWIEEMLGICQHKQVGIVGAKMYYPDHTIQHAGVILGLGNVAGHLFVKESGDIQGYLGKACTMQNLSAVTAACMMVDREAFDKVQGFDETLKVALNDVDFCLKVEKAGWQVVFCPEAELYHYESKSRGLEDTPEKKARYDGEVAYFMERWGQLLEKGDPYYSPNLSRTKWNCSFRIPQK